LSSVGTSFGVLKFESYDGIWILNTVMRNYPITYVRTFNVYYAKMGNEALVGNLIKWFRETVSGYLGARDLLDIESQFRC
jgi:hypothetical protein